MGECFFHYELTWIAPDKQPKTVVVVVVIVVLGVVNT